jgi:hypothetical protein
VEDHQTGDPGCAADEKVDDGQGTGCTRAGKPMLSRVDPAPHRLGHRHVGIRLPSDVVAQGAVDRFLFRVDSAPFSSSRNPHLHSNFRDWSNLRGDGFGGCQWSAGPGLAGAAHGAVGLTTGTPTASATGATGATPQVGAKTV